MKATQQIKKRYTFMHREIAVECAKQDLVHPDVEEVVFNDNTYIEEGKENKYEVRTTFKQTPR